MSVNVGYGSDEITLNMAEDSAAGQDAEFTVNVDGQQIGGVQTVTAEQSQGQTESFNFFGDYAPGEHNVTVTFVNNYLYPGTPGDRNVYVDGVSYDGSTVSSSTTPIYQSPWFPPNSIIGDVWGNAVYGVNDTTAIPAGATPEQTTTPGAVSVGNGPDKLVLQMAEDPYQGDAQFTVSVDGQQIGGVQTTTAVVSEGQSQEFDVYGNFGGGTHDVAVTYLNDQIGGFYPAGTPIVGAGTAGTDQWALDTADRNLYVMNVSLDGGANAPNAPWELSNDGTQDFYVTSGGNSGSTTSATISASTGASNPSISFAAPSTGTSDTTGGNSSSGNIPAATSGGGAAGAPADTLTLHLAEDAWNGDAQFSVSIDGQTIGSQAVTASHSAGNWEDLTFSGNFGAGPHDVGVTFTNDAYGGSPATDRNLYVNGVDFNGAHYGTGVTGLYTNGTAHFAV